MRRKPLIAVILAVCLCMAGCSFPKDKDSNEPNRVGFSPSEGIPKIDWNHPPMDPELADADREQLLATAEILTQQIVNNGLERSNLFEGQNPSIDDRGIYRVLVSTVDYEENESYLYHNFFFKKEEDYYLHFPSEKVRQMVYEVFGIENWTYLSNEMEYDAQKDEYFIMGDFGREITLECTNIECQIDSSNREVTVRYDLMTSSNIPDVRMIGVYETRFSIQARPDGSHYLRYLETTKESFESSDETEGKPPLYEEPTEEELAELFCDAILEINNLATEDPCDVIRRRFGDVTIDSDDCIIIDEFPYARTSLDYSELVEYYANIFTDEALEWVLSTKFADVEGTMYCCLTGGQTGTGMQLHSIEKLREYTYQATFLSYYGIDETVGNSVVVVFEVKKTDAGYRISSTDYCPASLN